MDAAQKTVQEVQLHERTEVRPLSFRSHARAILHNTSTAPDRQVDVCDSSFLSWTCLMTVEPSKHIGMSLIPGCLLSNGRPRDTMIYDNTMSVPTGMVRPWNSPTHDLI